MIINCKKSSMGMETIFFTLILNYLWKFDQWSDILFIRQFFPPFFQDINSVIIDGTCRRIRKIETFPFSPGSFLLFFLLNFRRKFHGFLSWHRCSSRSRSRNPRSWPLSGLRGHFVANFTMQNVTWSTPEQLTTGKGWGCLKRHTSLDGRFSVVV